MQDTGKGIAPDDLPYIWDRYYKQTGSHKRPTVGTGLGLSIVKAILVAHGAPVGVQSAGGVGSTFWFELPVPAAPPALPLKAPKDPRQAARRDPKKTEGPEDVKRK